MLAMALPAMAQRKMPRRIITPPAEFNLATYNIRLPAGSDSVQGNGWGASSAISGRTCALP